ncbi:hypothetical protein CEXT_651411 [Caerostris extrusa]|uniref:Uncharacterized protein n=1 Tax=Caerostris extrusa TaxID=172846 RepID=A0AAV4T8I4_CAEEX|nr:hypothetical protein CEXT_651411 [Caerostris extrusa]
MLTAERVTIVETSKLSKMFLSHICPEAPGVCLDNAKAVITLGSTGRIFLQNPRTEGASWFENKLTSKIE